MSSLLVSMHPMAARPPPTVTEHVDLAKSQDSNWIDATTCLFNVILNAKGEEASKISTIIKVFSNKQVLVTLTDNAKFGSTYSAKKVSLDGPQMADPFGNMGMLGGTGAAMQDDFEPFDADAEEAEEDTVETHLLLGDRKSQEIGELLTINLFHMLSTLPKFSGLESMVLQVSLSTLRSTNQS